VGSFSRTLFPSLRLGYVVCPESLRTDLCAAKRLDDLGSTEIVQVALAAFIRSGQFAKYLQRSTTQPSRRETARSVPRECAWSGTKEVGPEGPT
jgi:GntR family transcriptional regulator / MocR family aminotransferase